MIPGWLNIESPPLRQAIRVMVGSVIAFAAYRLLGLPQGFWAVVTVVIVLQGSVGGTVGAAMDRLAGTVAGAILGGIAILIAPHTTTGIGLALATVVFVTGLVAAIRPQMRVAPITAAILLLTARSGSSPEIFVLERIGEIALGGVVGVATSLLVLPARSNAIVIEHATDVLSRCATFLRTMVEALRSDPIGRVTLDNLGLRKALGAVETAMTDAERERQSRLGDHNIPEALPRTLWRIRNDIVTISRGMETTLPALPGAPMPPIFAAILDAMADYLDRCGTALTAGGIVDRGDLSRRRDDFAGAIQALRSSQATMALDFDAMGRLYGMIFAVEQLYRNLGDLANRIDETAAAPVRRRPFSRSAD